MDEKGWGGVGINFKALTRPLDMELVALAPVVQVGPISGCPKPPPQRWGMHKRLFLRSFRVPQSVLLALHRLARNMERSET